MSQQNDPTARPPLTPRTRERVRITDPNHPHYPETGWLTGEIIKPFWGTMGKVQLDHCKHEVDACYVWPSQITPIPHEGERQRPRRRRNIGGDDGD